MLNFDQIDEARKTLGLDERAAAREIKDAYHKLAFKYHPDKCKAKNKKRCEDTFKKISHANDLLMAYVAGYKYSFKERDVERNIMDEYRYKHLKRFYDGWWGDLDL